MTIKTSPIRLFLYFSSALLIMSGTYSILWSLYYMELVKKQGKIAHWFGGGTLEFGMIMLGAFILFYTAFLFNGGKKNKSCIVESSQ